jgi:transposase InsO family protein
VHRPRAAGAALGQHRSTQRKLPRGHDDEARLTDDIIELTRTYGRYGYRQVTALLNEAGWCVNHKRVERIWRREGLKVPQKQKKRGRLWLNDGSCILLRPERPNHVWSYEFMQDRAHEGRAYRILNSEPLLRHRWGGWLPLPASRCATVGVLGPSTEGSHPWTSLPSSASIWRRAFSRFRIPPPAPESFVPMDQGPVMH